MARQEDLARRGTPLATFGEGYADGYAISVPFLARIRAALSRHVRGDVLDVGNGGLATWDVRRASSATFVDLAHGALRSAKTVGDGAIRALTGTESARVRRAGGDALELPFVRDAFDVVVMSYVAHHLSVRSRRGSRGNVACAFAEVHRVLRPGGTFLLLENVPTWPVKAAQDGGFALWSRLLLGFGKPLPYFLSRAELRRLSGADRFAEGATERIAWCPRVHHRCFRGGRLRGGSGSAC